MRKLRVISSLSLLFVPGLSLSDYRIIGDQTGASGTTFLDILVGLVIFVVFLGWWSYLVIDNEAKLWLYIVLVGGFGAVLTEFSKNEFGQTLGWVFIGATVIVWFLRSWFDKPSGKV
ncbi:MULTISPECIES: hypothetical protein [unclassified Thioalkalivibrio]|uniref:hypothetical protein n=1 Tax=unclassified Thioalkalivibrio TaxID=2621013 RepID=UPI0012DCCE4D|nr:MULTISPECIES: hypothetical protein [unclassified Thioalkalivibrio]